MQSMCLRLKRTAAARCAECCRCKKNEKAPIGVVHCVTNARVHLTPRRLRAGERVTATHCHSTARSTATQSTSLIIVKQVGAALHCEQQITALLHPPLNCVTPLQFARARRRVTGVVCDARGTWWLAVAGQVGAVLHREQHSTALLPLFDEPPLLLYCRSAAKALMRAQANARASATLRRRRRWRRWREAEAQQQERLRGKLSPPCCFAAVLQQKH